LNASCVAAHGILPSFFHQQILRDIREKIPKDVFALRQFDGLCSGLEKLVASSGRPAFRALIGVHREKLVAAIKLKRREQTGE
jgi:hypothetical protein